MIPTLRCRPERSVLRALIRADIIVLKGSW